MQRLYRDFSTQAEIDAQYNAGAAVPDFAAWVRRWQERSAQARERLGGQLRVPYGPTLAETLDIFAAPARAARPAPVFVFLHGGYWRAFAAHDFHFVALGLHELGFVTVTVDYALCPWVGIDEIVRQVRASLAWVHRNIARHGGDPDRIVLGGHSAGGHLTAMSLLTDWPGRYGLPADLVKAAVPISGLFDLRPLRWSYLQPSLQLGDGVVARNSPQLHARRIDAPMRVCWGEAESSEFARQSHAYADALVEAGSAHVERHAIAQAHHFAVLDEFLSADSHLCRWIGETIRRLPP